MKRSSLSRALVVAGMWYCILAVSADAVIAASDSLWLGRVDWLQWLFAVLAATAILVYGIEWLVCFCYVLRSTKLDKKTKAQLRRRLFFLGPIEVVWLLHAYVLPDLRSGQPRDRRDGYLSL